LLTEIQQTSDATLRIYDFDRVDEKGRPRTLHTENALEAIDFKAYPQYKTRYAGVPNKPSLLARCEYFTTNYLMLHEPVEREYHHIDSFVIFICLEGKLDIHFTRRERETLYEGETTLLPAEIKDIRLMSEGKANSLKSILSLKNCNPIEDMLDIIL
jgi:mannose-6-phosphate isomerase